MVIAASENPGLQRHLDIQLLAENGTFCLLPTNMRCFCLLLTVLLIVSLASAIGNSMQTSKILSASHCKENITDPGVGILCPKESMFKYYVCCKPSPVKPRNCCSQLRFWLLVAMIGIISSFIIGICFLLARYLSSAVFRH